MALGQETGRNPLVDFFTLSTNKHGQPFANGGLLRGIRAVHWNLPGQEVAKMHVGSVIVNCIFTMRG